MSNGPEEPTGFSEGKQHGRQGGRVHCHLASPDRRNVKGKTAGVLRKKAPHNEGSGHTKEFAVYPETQYSKRFH